jgi:hypothetical protein
MDNGHGEEQNLSEYLPSHSLDMAVAQKPFEHSRNW